jgi:hypothetical protein
MPSFRLEGRIRKYLTCHILLTLFSKISTTASYTGTYTFACLAEQSCASFLQKEELYIYMQLLRQTPEILQHFRDGQVRVRTRNRSCCTRTWDLVPSYRVVALRQTPEILQHFRDGQVRVRTRNRSCCTHTWDLVPSYRVVANCSTARLHCWWCITRNFLYPLWVREDRKVLSWTIWWCEELVLHVHEKENKDQMWKKSWTLTRAEIGQCVHLPLFTLLKSQAEKYCSLIYCKRKTMLA